MGRQTVSEIETHNEMLEEYKVLRSEISMHQQSRLGILGFTLGAVGTIGGVVFTQVKPDSSASYISQAVGGTLFFALLIVVVALLLTIGVTQSIDHIGNYIRYRIEPELDGINWESEWEFRRQGSSRVGKFKRYGISKIFALSYAVLILGISLTALLTARSTSTEVLQPILWACLLPLVIAIFLCIDLWFRILSGWTNIWQPQSYEEALNKQ